MKNNNYNNEEILFKKVNRILANTPYVNDIFKWNVKGKPKKGYQIIEGDKNLLTDIVLKDNRGKSKKN